MTKMTREPALAFVDQLRAARLDALRDAEAFDGIIHAVERLGSYITKYKFGDFGKYGDLGKYAQDIETLVEDAAASWKPDEQFRDLQMPFNTLYDLVREARNDALHQGAFARHLTEHAIQLAIILEDSLKTCLKPVVTDFMIRNPVCAEHWQPVGFLRQQMLANSYSFLPVLCEDKKWRLVSDAAIAQFLGPEREGPERTKRLSRTLKKAIGSSDSSLKLTDAGFGDRTTSIEVALKSLRDAPVLLVKNSADAPGLLGIVTAFDLL